MRLSNSLFELEWNPLTGALIGLRSPKKNFIAEGERPLFVLRFRDEAGCPQLISSSELGSPVFHFEARKGSIHFDGWENSAVRVTVWVELSATCAESEWTVEIEHGRKGMLEWMEFPRVVVPNNLGATCDDGQIFWPALEGVLIEDLDQREGCHLRYQEIEYPNAGWCGYYPGAVPFQFLAYQTGGEVLYFASHDPDHTTKEIEYCRDEDGVRLIQKVFLDAAPAGKYRLPYPLVLSVLEGDWQAACERYRTWCEGGRPVLSIAERVDTPAWMKDSPLVVTYPITGVGHHSGPTNPNEYFPFTRALPTLEKLGREVDSRLLVLLMHWEGTAPWAPPYVWPPLGGEEGMIEFAKGLHERNHLLGLYCSGIAWTNTADTGPGNYNRTQEFEEKGLIQHMCRGPKGEYECKICNGEGIRYGYDICAATDFAREVVTSEALKIAAAGVDYIQLFDQNLGCAAYQCYAAAHSHPAGPGVWQAKVMRGLLSHVRSAFQQAGCGHVVIGCEAAAAEPFLLDLPTNDLRFHMGFCMGKPVPAYAYLFHESSCNFMGNQVEALVPIDEVSSPWNLAYRLAYSFIAGDLLTVVLKENGDLHWSWCTKWEVAAPPQKMHWDFIKHLNAWRQHVGEPFLFGGRMLTAPQLSGASEVSLALRWGRALKYPGVLISQWQSATGERAVFLVNYLEHPQSIQLALSGEVHVLRNPLSRTGTNVLSQNGGVKIEMDPMSAVMLQLK